MRRGATIAILSAVGLFASALQSNAATTTVEMTDQRTFVPARVTVAIGDTVRWSNTGVVLRHTATQASMGLWDTGDVQAGQSADVSIQWGGIFPYICVLHEGAGMVGKVRSRIKFIPMTGPGGPSYKIRLATVAAPEDHVYDVQIKEGTGDWTRFRRGVTTRSVTFKPDQEGTYSFRSRIRQTTGGKTASGFSPSVTFTTSG